MAVRIRLIFVLLICAFFLSGCKTTLLVHNTTVKQITPIFKDYAGTHGYTVTFANEQTGSYHISMGNVYVPYASSTTKNKSTIQYTPPAGSSQPLTAYEETSWNTVAMPGHYNEASAAVTIIQQGTDVMIILDGNDAAGSSLNDFQDYLNALGYAVDTK